MKMKLPILALSAMLLVGLASCGSKPSTPTTSVQEAVTVESVTISGYDETRVLGGTNVNLTADVKSNRSDLKLKVTWSTSDDKVATVKNGVVRFLKVSENKEVIITATSNDDNSKSASVKFTVVHSTIDLANSRGNIDSSMFLSDGVLSTEIGDVALVYDSVYSTKWYVEATITLDDFLESDLYPKFGIMTGTSAGGYWNVSAEKFKNAFFYVDTMKNSLSTGWTSFNFVTQTELLDD